NSGPGMIPVCRSVAALVLVLGCVSVCPAEEKPAPDKYFRITVVDEDTGRGVPLVELQTVNGLRSYTDSNGVVAFLEPGLMGGKGFFHVKSPGYEFPKDGLGFPGQAPEVTEGGPATLP